MTPQARAKLMVPLDAVAGKYVVTLGDDSWRLILSTTPDLNAAESTALIGRHIVAGAIRRAKADEACRIAAAYDQRIRERGLSGAAGFSEWCREQAQLHTKGLDIEW